MVDFFNYEAKTPQASDPNKFSAGEWASIRAFDPDYYATVKGYDPVFRAEQQAAQEAANAASIASQTSAASQVNAPVVPAGPTQEESASKALSDLLAGFGGDSSGANFVPGSFDDTAISGVFDQKRGKAQSYIDTLLKRGAVTDSGRQRGVQAIEGQAPKVRDQLNNIGNLLLERERGNVRGIYNSGAVAAGGTPAGGTFDPSPYVSQAQGSVATFGAGLADAIAGQVPGDLFDTSGLSEVTGAPSSGQTNLDYDPYAAPGGQLKTGLEGQSSPSQKRRSTAVF